MKQLSASYQDATVLCRTHPNSIKPNVQAESPRKVLTAKQMRGIKQARFVKR